MTGPLAQMFALMEAKRRQGEMPDPRMPPQQQDLYSMVNSTAEPMGPPTPRFRDPDQMGPAPPTGIGPLARMYGGR